MPQAVEAEVCTIECRQRVCCIIFGVERKTEFFSEKTVIIIDVRGVFVYNSKMYGKKRKNPFPYTNLASGGREIHVRGKS